MSVPIAVGLFVVSLAVSVVSSIVLARKLDRVGERLGFSEALLGMVTAVGADAPEISAAVTALVAGHTDTGVGVVVGSNIFNLAALLGLSALLAGRVRIHSHGLVLNGGVAVLVALAGTALVLGWISGVVALVLSALLLAPYVALSSLPRRRRALLPAPIREALVEEQQDARRDEHAPPATTLDAFTVVPALALVIGSSVGMVTSTQSLGHRWGISDVVIGTLVLAALTGIPNVLAAIRLALHGRGAACVSEALNSNNANILVGLCVPVLVLGLGAVSGLERLTAWWMLGMTIVAVALCYGGGGLRRVEGVGLIALYAAFAGIVATR